jgi:hypothetical protein
MGLMAKSGGNGEPRELVPAGGYFAVVCGVYDIGTQAGGMYGPKRQFVVTWELHKKSGPATDSQGRALTISNFYTLAFSEKANLRHDVESMLGITFSEATVRDGFDIETLLSVPCRLRVVHGKKADGSPRDEIGSLMPLDEDDPKVQPALDHHYFEIRPGEREIPDWVPKWVANKIAESQEFGAAPRRPAAPARPAMAAAGAPVDDDCPF